MSSLPECLTIALLHPLFPIRQSLHTEPFLIHRLLWSSRPPWTITGPHPNTANSCWLDLCSTNALISYKWTLDTTAKPFLSSLSSLAVKLQELVQKWCPICHSACHIGCWTWPGSSLKPLFCLIKEQMICDCITFRVSFPHTLLPEHITWHLPGIENFPALGPLFVCMFLPWPPAEEISLQVTYLQSVSSSRLKANIFRQDLSPQNSRSLQQCTAHT